jgi:hypothetical protein
VEFLFPPVFQVCDYIIIPPHTLLLRDVFHSSKPGTGRGHQDISLYCILIVKRGFIMIVPYMNGMYFDQICLICSSFLVLSSLLKEF